MERRRYDDIGEWVFERKPFGKAVYLDRHGDVGGNLLYRADADGNSESNNPGVEPPAGSRENILGIHIANGISPILAGGNSLDIVSGRIRKTTRASNELPYFEVTWTRDELHFLNNFRRRMQRLESKGISAS